MTQSKKAILKTTFATLLSPVGLGLWLAVTIAVVVTGPFGTYTTLSLGQRAAYWGLIMLTAIPLRFLCVALARMIWRGESAVACDIFGLLLVIPVITTDFWVISHLMIWSEQTTLTYGLLLSFVTVLALAANLPKYLVRRPLPDPESPEDAAVQEPDPPRLMNRLPEVEGASVLHLSVQDHFVEINTCKGSHSLRMRFRDALNELDGVNGYRVHRSHWVAHEAITGVEREKTRVFLQLSNGSRIPVSRNYRSALEEAGVL